MNASTDIASSNQSETEALRKDLEQLRKDFSSLSQDVQKTSGTQVQAGLDKANQGLGFVSKELKLRPFTSIIAAFGLGLLLGKLLNR